MTRREIQRHVADIKKTIQKEYKDTEDSFISYVKYRNDLCGGCKSLSDTGARKILRNYEPERDNENLCREQGYLMGIKQALTYIK